MPTASSPAITASPSKTTQPPPPLSLSGQRSLNHCRNLNPKVELKNLINYSRAGDGHTSSVDSGMPDPIIASTSSSPILIDGFEEDAVLARSNFLHRAEVLRRRSRRVKQLARIYREYYWALMEELKIKYREYYWEYGKSPFQEDNEENNISNGNRVDSSLGNGENPNRNNLIGSSNVSNRCGVSTCKTKAMAMTRFCHAHILSDPKQKLYKACNYVIKSSPAGPILCGKPVLRSVVPSLCSPHMERADKHATRALKKAGLNVSSASKITPKFQVILVEFVNQIQNRRRSLKAAAALENS
ncbi:unnamed protein product [Cuscuta europaea]|uniref:KAT8 regulatory NSL complex subunit 2 n=1 Tax=Cuscuta europaea TaxID=41803 RepID=A0A9P0ZLM7_CUSEU|nr:unnamed protein product [Cuscuta europaea]